MLFSIGSEVGVVSDVVFRAGIAGVTFETRNFDLAVSDYNELRARPAVGFGYSSVGLGNTGWEIGVDVAYLFRGFDDIALISIGVRF